MKKELVKVETMKDVFEYLSTVKTGKTKRAYKLALRYLNLLPNYLKANVRMTKNQAYNIGDIGEIVVKYLLADTKKRVLRVSAEGERDLDRFHKSEIKTFTVANRKANAMTSRKGFTALTPNGLTWIPYSVWSKYLYMNDDISYATLKQMISENDLETLEIKGL